MFGTRLLSGMLKEVQDRGGCDQIGLFVDPDNPLRARHCAELGFQELDLEQDRDRSWVRMVRSLK